MTQPNQSTALTTLTTKQEFALKVGKNHRNIDAMTAVAVGHKEAMVEVQNLAFKIAFLNARHGRYRAAVEILQFAAAPAQFKATCPADGNWNKKRLGMLVELILGRATPKSGKWTTKALIGRTMAKLLDDLLEGRPLPPEYAALAEDAKPTTPAPTTPAPTEQPKAETPEPGSLAALPEANF